jgi:hypothetical protein
MTLGTQNPIFYPSGREMHDWEIAVERMDDYIRDEIHDIAMDHLRSSGKEMSDQEFFDLFTKKAIKIGVFESIEDIENYFES